MRFDAHTPYTVLERQHLSLREGLARLRSMLGPERRETDELGRQIRTVRDQLSTQFAFEERMGHMPFLLAVRPSFETRLTRLRAEHREILATLDRAGASLRGAPPTPEDVRTTVLSLLERFARHELDERQLLRSALRQVDPPAPAS
jgi:hypothetical protein